MSRRPPSGTGIEEFLLNVKKAESADREIIKTIYDYLLSFPETEKWSNHRECRFGTTPIPKTRRGRTFIAFGLSSDFSYTYVIIPTFHGKLFEQENDIASAMTQHIKSKHFYGDDAIRLRSNEDRHFILSNMNDLKTLIHTAYKICL